MTIESQKKKIILAMLAVFILGGAVGAGATVVVIRHRIFSALNQGPMGVRRLLMERLAAILDLTPQQQIALDPIFARTHDKIIKFRMDHRADIERIIEEGINEALPGLEPAQQKKLKDFSDRWRQKFDMFDKERPLQK